MTLVRETITNLTTQRQNVIAGKIGNYAIFAGGRGPTNAVETYNNSLTKGTATALPISPYGGYSASTASYAVFTMFFPDDAAMFDNVVFYNTSLTQTTSTLPYKIGKGTATAVGSYALFAGGYNYSNSTYSDIVYRFNNSLTRTTTTALPNKVINPGSGNINKSKAFIYGGTISGGVYSNSVKVYNTACTQSSASNLTTSQIFENNAPVVNSKLLVCCGSYNNSGTEYTSTNVDVYNSSATKSTATPLSISRTRATSNSLTNYALFAGGYSHATSLYDTKRVDCYDTSLTRSNGPDLSASNQYMYTSTGININGYALIPGGSSCRVECYKELSAPTVIITTHPVSASYLYTDTPSALNIVISSSGATTTTYQWQQSTDGSTWSNISGATSNSYTPTW